MTKRGGNELYDAILNLTKKPKLDEPAPLILDEEDVTEADFEDGYDSDFLGDEEDQQHLQSLTELERETIIFERYEKREELKQAREEAIRTGKLKNQKEKRPEKKARKSAALSDMRAKREAKKQEPAVKPPKSQNLYEKKPTSPNEDEEEEEAKHLPANFKKITLTRRKLEKWVTEPFFEKTVLNCFVRVSIGENNRVRVYRFCRISGIKEKSLYKIEKTSTTKYLNLKFGKLEKSFPISLISNSDFTDSEFNSWIKASKDANEKIPNEKEIEQKFSEFEKTTEYAYTEVFSFFSFNKNFRKISTNVWKKRKNLENKFQVKIWQLKS
jgi:RNA polymerase-associated protein RTF1